MRTRDPASINSHPIECLPLHDVIKSIYNQMNGGGVRGQMTS